MEIQVLSEYGRVVCQRCKIGITYDKCAAHFRHIHKLDEEQTQALLQFDTALPATTGTPKDGESPVKNLPVYDGFSCIKCKFRSKSRDEVVRHFRVAQHLTGATGQKYLPVQLQCWNASQPQHGQWVVLSKDTKSNTTQSTYHELLRQAQEVIDVTDREGLAQIRTDDCGTRNALAAEFGWDNLFMGKSRPMVAAAVSSTGQCAKIAAKAFDRIWVQLVRRVYGTPVPQRLLLQSVEAGTPSGKKFSLPSSKKGRKDYPRAGQQFASFCFYVANKGKDAATKELSVRATDEQDAILQRIKILC